MSTAGSIAVVVSESVTRASSFSKISFISSAFRGFSSSRAPAPDPMIVNSNLDDLHLARPPIEMSRMPLLRCPTRLGAGAQAFKLVALTFTK
eukprot:21555-Rhodomonas_salina.5